jgi:hypothetical protein
MKEFPFRVLIGPASANDQFNFDRVCVLQTESDLDLMNMTAIFTSSPIHEYQGGLTSMLSRIALVFTHLLTPIFGSSPHGCGNRDDLPDSYEQYRL